MLKKYGILKCCKDISHKALTHDYDLDIEIVFTNNVRN